MKLCVNLVWPSKIILFVLLDAKFGYGLVHFVSWELWKLCFENLSWRQWVFENIWNHSHALHVMKIFSKLIMQKKILVFFFQKLWISIVSICFSISWKFYVFKTWHSASLDWYSIDSQLIETGKFSVFKYLTNFSLCINCV